MKQRYPDLVVRHKILGTMIGVVVNYGSDMTGSVARWQIFSISGAGYYWPKAQLRREKYFQWVNLQFIEDLFKEFDERTATGEAFII